MIRTLPEFIFGEDHLWNREYQEMEKWRISGSNISRSEKDLGNWTEEMRIYSFVIYCLLRLRVKENVYILCKVTFLP